ncbi:hypothetical protein PCASD_25766 [Puccinia coronata f. sp. avenae]|uniref:Uncharacterized protein n=1 Tax=Puccinia coronata f. sp. avenae TaxID=200324 RepID=A0A2N5TMR6_9BASI|nr:hypothetical protein PCASD_25766 [Puccinia coronata f. sp. avenae]
MSFISRLGLAGQRSGQGRSGCLTGRHHDNSSHRGDHDGKGLQGQITFGCNQQCPTVALSPTYRRLGSKSDASDPPHHATSSPISFDFLVPHLPAAIDPQFKKKFSKMFRSKSHRVAQKQSPFAVKSGQLKPKHPPQPAHPKQLAFDEMLRSNQTIYIAGVQDATPVASHRSREVLYSNIPLSSSSSGRSSR